MRREKISEIINNINSQYIEEAAVYTGEEKRQSPYVWLKWSAVAAGIVLIIFLNMAILGRTHTVTLDNGDTIKFVKNKSLGNSVEGKIECDTRDLTEEELYAQLIKHTKTLNYSRAVQGNGLIYLKEEKTIKKIKY